MSLGVSNEMQFAGQLMGAMVMGIADGPTEVHKITLARQILRDYQPYEGLSPSGHLSGAAGAGAREIRRAAGARSGAWLLSARRSRSTAHERGWREILGTESNPPSKVAIHSMS